MTRGTGKTKGSSHAQKLATKRSVGEKITKNSSSNLADAELSNGAPGYNTNKRKGASNFTPVKDLAGAKRQKSASTKEELILSKTQLESGEVSATAAFDEDGALVKLEVQGKSTEFASEAENYEKDTGQDSDSEGEIFEEDQARSLSNNNAVMETVDGIHDYQDQTYEPREKE